ncbi:MAG: hypothetical protein PHV80_02490 [Rugosibacter sp.]|nr:hypothetical protein [Rugosibacter sp.]
MTGLYDVVCKVNCGNVKRLNCDEQQMNMGLNQVIQAIRSQVEWAWYYPALQQNAGLLSIELLPGYCPFGLIVQSFMAQKARVSALCIHACPCA